MSNSEDNRPLRISTPLKYQDGDEEKEVFQLLSCSGAESISALFSFQLEMQSWMPDMGPSLLGKQVTVYLPLTDGEMAQGGGGKTERTLNGYISEFTSEGRVHGPGGNYSLYRATMVPWLWFLDQTSDCRIFQNKSVPDIVEEVFKDHQAKVNREVKLDPQKHRKRKYCVQYRETDFTFLSRLMESEGIFYYFKHEDTQHVMVLGDSNGAFFENPIQKWAASKGDLQSSPPPAGCLVSGWTRTDRYVPRSVATSDHNFLTPGKKLSATAPSPDPDCYELYDCLGGYDNTDDGETLARIRLEEQRSMQTVIHGGSDCRGFGAGHRFQMIEDYNEKEGFLPDDDDRYILIAVTHSANSNAHRSGGRGGGGFTYRNGFDCIPWKTPFRPLRLTHVPVMDGPQTAVVVGSSDAGSQSGDVVDADQYGRVKVKFHWDRLGKSHDCTCWIRVSQTSAGQGWGASFPPRVGQEVVVSFLHGDPDLPLITGRVHNAGQAPPWSPKEQKWKSGFKSNSSGDSGAYHEFSFDDTQGKELVLLHGERESRMEVAKSSIVMIEEEKKSSITLSVGKSSIVMKEDGTIEIAGVNISTTAEQAHQTQADQISSSASKLHEIHGQPVKINC